MRKLSAYGIAADDAAHGMEIFKFDGQLTFNKVTDVYQRRRHKKISRRICTFWTLTLRDGDAPRIRQPLSAFLSRPYTK